MAKPSRNKPAPFEHRNLPLLLLQARECLIAHFRPILNEHGITEQQWRIVRLLIEHGELEPREIGRLCSISSPSLAGILKRMDDLDLVNRIRPPHDQRRVLVSLSDKAQTLALEMAAQIDDTYEHIERQLGRDCARRLYSTLDELMAKLAPEDCQGGQ